MMDKKLITMVALFGAGVAMGGGIGYLTTNRLVKSKYEQIANEDIAAVKESYRLLRKEGDLSDPSTIVNNFHYKVPENLDVDAVVEKAEAYTNDPKEVAAYLDTLREQAYSDAAVHDSIDYGAAFDRDPKVMSERVQNLLDAVDEADPEVEDIDEHDSTLFVCVPSTEHPYVISYDSFMEENQHYNKISLTYFEEDETLTDEREYIIPDTEYVVGPDALTRFGDGNPDRDIVCVRNDKTESDYEVSRDKRGYAEVVLNIHPEKEPIRKMRVDD